MGSNLTTNLGSNGASPWIVDLTPGRRPRVTLLCLPYAGGGANIYRRWANALPPWVGVAGAQLPGRETRFADPLMDQVGPVVAGLAHAAATIISKRPLALFGHSMGAVLALELARALGARGAGEPCHLMVAGRCPPNHPPTSPPVHKLPDAELLLELQRLGGTPPQVLGDDNLMRLMLPMVRADFTLLETWKPEPAPPLSCPISTFAGVDDKRAPPTAQMAWASETTGPVAHHAVAGGHFFPNENRTALLELIASALGPLGPATHYP